MKFDNDTEAWAVLGYNFWDNKGLITRKDRTKLPTADQYEAIEYLWHEWDYAYEDE